MKMKKLLLFIVSLKLSLSLVVNPASVDACNSCCEEFFVQNGDIQTCQGRGCEDITDDCEDNNGLNDECELGKDFLIMGFAKNPDNGNQAIICNEDGEITIVTEILRNDFTDSPDLPEVSANECDQCCQTVNSFDLDGLFSQAACQNSCFEDFDDNTNLLPLCFQSTNNNGDNTHDRRLGCFGGADLKNFGILLIEDVSTQVFCVDGVASLEPPEGFEVDNNASAEENGGGGAAGAALGIVGVMVIAALLVLFVARQRKRKPPVRLLSESEVQIKMPAAAPSPDVTMPDFFAMPTVVQSQRRISEPHEFGTHVFDMVSRPTGTASVRAFYNSKRQLVSSPAMSL